MNSPELVNIASCLRLMAEKQPEEKAIFFPASKDRNGKVNYISYTFRELNRESDFVACGLEKSGIGRGTRTALMVRPSLDFFALTFAIFKAGAVPVMIDPGVGIRNLKNCLAQAEPEAFIGIPVAHVARILLGWGGKTVRTSVTVGKKLFWGGLTLEQIKERGRSDIPYEMADTRGDEMAAILFTSGGTGPPKGAVYTHANFAAQVEMIRKTYNIEPGEIDLPTFPLFALFNPALGMTAVIPDMDATRPAHVEPENIIRPIRKFGITNMFGSPALINRVGRYGSERGVKLPSLRRVIAAGAPMPAEALERFCSMLVDDAQVFTGYGATEAMPACSIGSREILGETRYQTDKGKGVCIGKPVDGMDVSVIKITDTAVPGWRNDLVVAQGEIGEIAVRGPSVTGSYYNKETATRLAKIYDAEGEGFRHRMGDLGFVDEQGRLWFCGRKVHRVILPTMTLLTIPCEGVFNTHPKVYRTALVGVKLQGATRPVLCVELEKDSRDADRELIKNELLELGAAQAHTKDIRTILFHKAFPVDIRHNAKIFRDRLAVWAKKKLE